MGILATPSLGTRSCTSPQKVVSPLLSAANVRYFLWLQESTQRKQQATSSSLWFHCQKTQCSGNLACLITWDGKLQTAPRYKLCFWHSPIRNFQSLKKLHKISHRFFRGGDESTVLTWIISVNLHRKYTKFTVYWQNNVNLTADNSSFSRKGGMEDWCWGQNGKKGLSIESVPQGLG